MCNYSSFRTFEFGARLAHPHVHRSSRLEFGSRREGHTCRGEITEVEACDPAHTAEVT